MLVASQAFFGRKSCLQDELSIREKQDAFLRKRYIFACAVEQFCLQLFFQCLNLVTDRGLSNLERA